MSDPESPACRSYMSALRPTPVAGGNASIGRRASRAGCHGPCTGLFWGAALATVLLVAGCTTKDRTIPELVAPRTIDVPILSAGDLQLGKAGRP
jgi:hypothetical protein